jgi:GNAT superfamily N-acetyltransferase
MSAATHPVRVRIARVDEADGLGAIAREAKGHWGYAPEQLEAWRDELTLRMAQIARSVALVAEAAGRPRAVALAAPGVPWELEHLWVLPAWQGRGIGRRLLEKVCARVRARSGTGLRIVSDPFAAGFYRRMGAIAVGSVAAPIDGAPGRELPVFLLPTNRILP